MTSDPNWEDPQCERTALSRAPQAPAQAPQSLGVQEEEGMLITAALKP